MLSKSDSSMKMEIPKVLYHAIIRIQAAENLDWDEACVKAATLMDTGSKSFKKEVDKEALRLEKRQFMTQLNTTRDSIKTSAYNEGVNYTRNNEDNFKVPCSVCGKPMYFSNRDPRWGRSRRLFMKLSRFVLCCKINLMG